jgi:hypothetical protein
MALAHELMVQGAANSVLAYNMMACMLQIALLSHSTQLLAGLQSYHRSVGTVFGSFIRVQESEDGTTLLPSIQMQFSKQTQFWPWHK